MNSKQRQFLPMPGTIRMTLCGGVLSVLILNLGFCETMSAQGKNLPYGNIDVRVNAPATLSLSNLAVNPAALAKSKETLARNFSKGMSQLKAAVPGVEVRVSSVTGGPEIVSAAGALTAPSPGRPGIEIVKDFIQANALLYGLGSNDIAHLRFIGESVSRASGLRMVRVEQIVNGHPVFQSDTRFIIDREGRLIRSVGLLAPDASVVAPAPVNTLSAQEALASAMASVRLALEPARMTLTNTQPGSSKTEVVAVHPQIKGHVPSELVYFPLAPGVLVLAWSQVTMTRGEGDWYTLVDAKSGILLWRKNIRAHASTQEARFNVYVQADGKTPADSPAPLSPTTATSGSGLQPAGIARTTVNMSVVQNIVASPNGWITDGDTTTTGNNVDAYMDADTTPDSPDTTLFFRLDGNGRPTGNPDTAARDRDFLGTTPRDFTMLPPPQGGNPESGQTATGNGNNGGNALDAFRRGAVTHLFYIANWYHDQLFDLGFDEAAGNFQTINFSAQGSGNDHVLAEAQDESGTDNANFSTPPDGQSGRMQMYRFTGPTVDRDGGLDAEIVIHELTHGLSNRLIGNGSGLIWDVGAGMGEGWSDFYALSLLNNSNADDPNGKYAAGAYATYKAFGSTTYLDNYLYGIRRFPYSTDNTVNPLTWADVDDVTLNTSGGIAASPLNFTDNGGGEVHNIGEIWCNTLWEVRSRIIADPAGANGNVPTGNNKMLEIVTDGLKMTPISPSFIDARDALLAADAAANASANELSIWQGFADRGLGYNAVAPFSRMFGYSAGHIGIGESFDVPYLDVQSVAISDSLGNNNGAIDPGEPIKITVKLKNPWRKASFGVASATATLTTATPGVVIMTGTSTYPAIAALGNADGTQFKFTVPSSATAGQALNFTITPTSSLGTKAVNFTLRVGTSAGNGAPITYSKTIAGGLAIPDNSPRGVVSTLTISDDLEITDLNFRVDNLTHTWTGDVTALLRAPNGLGSDLITALGGGSDGGPGNNFVNTVIDDQAGGDLLLVTAASAPFTGSWKPIFNNASWGGFGFPHDPTGTLSRYNGLSTKGDWKLLVSDQAAPDAGTLNTWSIIVTPKAYTVTPFSAPSLSISGTAAYVPSVYPPISPSTKKVQNVTMNLSGNATASTLTASDGTFNLSSIPYAGDYCVTPRKTNDSTTANGVDTFDIAFIRQHILSPANSTLTTPYRLLAADVDGSGSVNTFDIVYIRQVILAVTNRFPAGLWRFVPYNYNFPNTNSPWTAPTNSCDTDLIANATGKDFVAIKLGDVNDSWTAPGAFAGEVSKGNSAADAALQVVFETSSHATLPGQTVTAAVSARGFRQVTSAQFTLAWDPAVLRFAGFGNFGIRGLSAGNFGTAMITRGRLTFAWDDPQIAGASTEDGAALFTVSFEVIGAPGSNSALSFSDTPTAWKVGVNFAAASVAGRDGQVTVIAARPAVALPNYSQGTFRLSVPTVAGQQYVLEFAESLPAPIWTPLSTISGDGTIKVLLDSSATNRQRYYRVRVE